MTPKRKPPAHLRAAETRARKSAPLPRAVRELLRDVASLVYTSAHPFDDMCKLGALAARILGTTPADIVAKARKAGRR